MNNVILFLQKAKRKRGKKKKEMQKVLFLFLERERYVSLKSRAIGPSKSFGARRKVILRSEAYAWAPVLRSFDKIREIGVLSYLFYS